MKGAQGQAEGMEIFWLVVSTLCLGLSRMAWGQVFVSEPLQGLVLGLLVLQKERVCIAKKRNASRPFQMWWLLPGTLMDQDSDS